MFVVAVNVLTSVIDSRVDGTVTPPVADLSARFGANELTLDEAVRVRG